MRCGRMTAGQNEGPQGRQRLIERIDLPFQPLDLGGNDPQRLLPLLDAALRRAEIGPEIEQIVLDQPQHLVERRKSGLRQVQPHHADDRVGLVDRAIGLDPQRRFLHPFAGAERRRAFVPRLGVNPVEHHHRHHLPSATIREAGPPATNDRPDQSLLRCRAGLTDKAGQAVATPATIVSAIAANAVHSATASEKNASRARGLRSPTPPPSRSAWRSRRR